METGQRNLVKKIELQEILDGIEMLNKQIGEVEKIGENDEFFKPIRVDLRAQAAALDEECNRLFETIGLNKRTKRGLVNLGGEVLKFLFGTMSNDDAVAISESIKKLDSNQELLANEAKSTATLMVQLNESNKILKRNQDKEKANFEKAIGDINSKINQSIIWEQVQGAHNTLARWIIAARLEVDELRNAIQFLKTGVVDPYILERKELKMAINGGNFGYNISENDVDDIYKIATFSTYVNSTSHALFVVIKLPVTNGKLADLYTVVRIPQVKMTSMVVIKEIKSLLLVSKDKQKYWQGFNFDHHKIGETIIGKGIIWSELRENASCEATVFKFKTDRECEYMDWTGQWEAELITSEGYLLVWTTERNVSFDCPKEKGVLSIGEPTRIKADLSCRINGSDFELERKISKSNIVMGDIQVKVKCCSKFEILRHHMGGTVNWEQEGIPDMDSQVKLLQKEAEDYKKVQLKTKALVITPITILLILAFGFWVTLTVRACRGRVLINQVNEQSV